MMKTVKKVPELRFPEFEGEWQQKNLGSISHKISYGLNAAAIEFDGKNKYIRITDIDEKSNRFIPNPLTSPNGTLDDFYQLSEGDIVFARTGASVGKSYLYNNSDGRLYFAGFLIRFSILGKNSAFFVHQLSLRYNYNKWVQTMSMRSGQPGLNAEEYKSLELFLPTLPEQQKIASFLSAADKRIHLLTQKKEKLEQYKKGIMQQIFSQQLRFKDENGQEYPEWKEKRLGEISEIFKGKGISKDDISSEGKIECIRYGELYTSYNEKIINVISKTNCRHKDLIFSKKLDVIMPASGETQIDIARASCVMKDGVALGSDLNIIRSSINGVYLAYFLNGSLKYEIAKAAQGISVIHIYGSQLKGLKIKLPTKQEQQKIATFLSSIDQRITLVNQQIDLTRKWKQGLLQKMFV